MKKYLSMVRNTFVALIFCSLSAANAAESAPFSKEEILSFMRLLAPESATSFMIQNENYGSLKSFADHIQKTGQTDDLLITALWANARQNRMIRNILFQTDDNVLKEHESVLKGSLPGAFSYGEIYIEIKNTLLREEKAHLM